MRSPTAFLSLVLSACLILATACGASPPRWYEGGETNWELELVEPDLPELVVEGTIHQRGPYRFLLDPDAPASVIDDQVARDLNLYSNYRYVRVVNQKDVSMPRRLYEVLALDVGELHIRNVRVLNAPAGSLRAGGKPVHAILGSDLLSRTIVVGIDRDAGKVALALTGHAAIPRDATAVRGWLHYDSFYVPVTIRGKTLTMQVRLSSSVSTLRGERLAELGLDSFSGETLQVDETGTTARLVGGGVGNISLNGVSVDGVRFYRHADRRERRDFHYDGVIGQDVLSRFRVVVDRDRKTLYLSQRAAVTANR